MRFLEPWTAEISQLIMPCSGFEKIVKKTIDKKAKTNYYREAELISAWENAGNWLKGADCKSVDSVYDGSKLIFSHHFIIKPS